MFQKISASFLFSFFFSGFIFCQGYKEDFQLLIDKMENATSVLIEVEINVQSSKNGASIYTGNASLCKDRNKSKNVLGDAEIISTPDYELRVDNEEKSMLVLKKEKTTRKQKEEHVKIDENVLKYLLDENQDTVSYSVKMIKSNANSKVYSITGAVGFRSIEIELDMVNMAIKRIEMEYDSNSQNGNSGQYVVLTYKKFEYDVDISGYLNLSKYFKITDKKIVLTEKYKNYKLFTEL